MARFTKSPNTRAPRTERATRTRVDVPTPVTRPFAGFQFLPIGPPRVRRVVQLMVGLVLFAIALALTVEPRLGASPWTVFHEGASDLTGLTFGTTVTLTGVALLAVLWLFNEPLGLGTVLNVVMIGPIADVSLAVIPDLDNLFVRVIMLAAAPLVLGLGSGLYLGAGVGPGPRDGLMTALNRRGVATWKARTAIELSALAVGFALGGVAGVGTVWMAIAVGPCVQFFLPWFRIEAT